MTRERHVIVNADDFGASPGVNRAIIEAHVRGIVTSASLMVRQPAAANAARLARSHPHLGIGLHVDLGEWIQRAGEWSPRYTVVDTADSAAVASEIDDQVARFVHLVGRNPDHLDSHQHVHLEEPTRSILRAVGRRLDIGVRRLHSRVGYHSLYGQDRDGTSFPAWISPRAYVDALASLDAGWTEFSCHPGYADWLASDYLAERELELGSLCDPSVIASIRESGLILATWSDVGHHDIRPLPAGAHG